MRTRFIVFVFIIGGLLNQAVYAQTENDEDLLGLPGDNLDLFAVLDLFQKSKTIEDFEKSLNDEKTGINNLDLNLDDKIDFIKVKTEQKEDDFTFILQVDVTEKETQDVAVILLTKDNEDKVNLQIVGDTDLYGKNYVVEPKPAVTPNPAYTGTEPVDKTEASSTVVVVESEPIVQYVYSPVYVPYYPPYYYGYYPPYFRPYAVISVGIYHNNYYHYHHGYHGGYGNNTVIIHNHNNYNNYNNNRRSSNTVNHYNANGNYNRNRASTGSGNRPSTGNVNKPTTTPTTRQSTPSANTRQSTSSTRQSKPSATTRQSTPSTRQQPSSNSYNRGNSGRSGGSYSGGGGRAGGFSGGRGGGGRR